jgi:CheY-like chemotaxis protein
MTVRVVIVDDDDISRRGMAEYLADHSDVEVLGALDHEQALQWSDQWDGADVALVDAADSRRSLDQFPGVEVVAHIRRQQSGDKIRVVVVTTHFFDDAVRRRMREAGADYFYYRPDLHRTEGLYNAVLHPEKTSVGVPDPSDPDEIFGLGIGRSSRVNDAVRIAADPNTRADWNRRTRARDAYRRTFNKTAHLHPMNADGLPPDRKQELPSITQIERFIRWATRIKQ